MNLSGSPLDFVFAFLWGALFSFTPCVYPLIPVTVGYVGAASSGSKFKGFSLSLLYVTGMAITYSALGVIATLTGTIFGKISSYPETYIILGVIVIILGLSMLDIFVLPFPNIVKLPEIKKKNYFSVFILGMACGLIVSPCLTPALASILVYLATKRNLLYGVFLLFSFAYGAGMVLILAGTFSGFLVNLPKSGKWLVHIKRICAVITLVAGMYFIQAGIRRL